MLISASKAIWQRLIFCYTLGLIIPAIAHPGQHEQLARATRAIEHNPEQQALYIQRGMIFSRGGQFDQARADFARAEQLGPAVAVAFELGVLHYRSGEYSHAIDYLDSYIEQFPSAAAAYDYRARARRAADDRVGAVNDLKLYFQLHASPQPGHYLSAAAMLQEMGETEAALGTLDQGLDKLGLTPQLQRQAVQLELARRQPDKAITRLETLRTALKESPGWKLEMAELLLAAGRDEAAVELLLAVESELDELRPTPARMAMQQQARDLQLQVHAQQAP